MVFCQHVTAQARQGNKWGSQTWGGSAYSEVQVLVLSKWYLAGAQTLFEYLVSPHSLEPDYVEGAASRIECPDQAGGRLRGRAILMAGKRIDLSLGALRQHCMCVTEKIASQ